MLEFTAITALDVLTQVTSQEDDIHGFSKVHGYRKQEKAYKIQGYNFFH